jgi:hypothetical protein
MQRIEEDGRGGWCLSLGGWANGLCLLCPLSGYPQLTARQYPSRTSQYRLDIEP